MKREQKNPSLPIPDSLEELRAREAEKKTAIAELDRKIAELQERFDNPRADDTAQTLGAVDEELRRARVDLRLATRDHEVAVAARTEAELAARRIDDERQRKQLEARLGELERSFPTRYRQLAQELVALVTAAHQLDRDISEFNKLRPPGDGSLATFEQRVRWPKPTEDGRRSFYPVPLASQFEIPALQAGDNFRVPGTRPPGGIWFDGNGRPRQS